MSEQFKVYKDEWWPTPVWYTDIDNTLVNPSLIAEEAIEQRTIKFGTERFPRQKSWAGDNMLPMLNDGHFTELNKLKNVVSNIAPIISKDFGFKNENLEIIEMWASIQDPNGMQTPHVHQYSLAAVYYAQASDAMGKIWFLNSSGSAGSVKSLTKNINKYNFEHVEYSPIVGRLIMFPSWLMHMTETNFTNTERISIAFDLK